MALFKISRGMAADLPKTYHEGYCYFTMDDGKFYIDTTDDASGRIVLNAASADTDRLNNIIDETYVTSEELDEIFDGVPGLIDADTLGGRLASDYLLKDEFSVNYDQIIMPDGTTWDGIAATITDTELSNESDNPVANRVITAALDNIVQTDWNENDNESFAYIKNRPFYDNKILGAEIYSTTCNFNISSGQKISSKILGKYFALSSTKYYAIKINDKLEYAESLPTITYKKSGTKYLVQEQLTTKNYSVQYYYSGLYDDYWNYGSWSGGDFLSESGTTTITMNSSDMTSQQATVTIYAYTIAPVKLAEKYIPDTIARTSDITNIDKLTSDPRENDEGNPEISAVPVNADTLGGIAASEYATKTQVSEIVTEALNNIRLASEVSF